MEETIYEYIVPSACDGSRADVVSAALCEPLTRSAAQKLLEDGQITCDGVPVSKKQKLREGDHLRIVVPAPRKLEAKPQNIPLDIVYEDEDLLVVNKPKGMVVHPAPGNPDGTLVNALLFHCGDSLSGINGVIRPGIVHRIDKDTSGLLVVAKNDYSHVRLAEQIKEHSFTREYRAVVHGNIRQDSGTVDAPIGRSPKDRKKMAVTDRHSRNAVTHFFILERYGSFTYIRCRLETGRTHQIRVHMAYIGHPLAGDRVYGPSNTPKNLNGQCLHAGLIGFIHPRTGEYMEFRSELPPYFQSFLRGLEPLRR